MRVRKSILVICFALLVFILAACETEAPETTPTEPVIQVTEAPTEPVTEPTEPPTVFEQLGLELWEGSKPVSYESSFNGFPCYCTVGQYDTISKVVISRVSIESTEIISKEIIDSDPSVMPLIQLFEFSFEDFVGAFGDVADIFYESYSEDKEPIAEKSEWLVEYADYKVVYLLAPEHYDIEEFVNIESEKGANNFALHGETISVLDMNTGFVITPENTRPNEVEHITVDWEGKEYRLTLIWNMYASAERNEAGSLSGWVMNQSLYVIAPADYNGLAFCVPDNIIIGPDDSYQYTDEIPESAWVESSIYELLENDNDYYYFLAME